jgi:hypothetical protein
VSLLELLMFSYLQWVPRSRPSCSSPVSLTRCSGNRSSVRCVCTRLHTEQTVNRRPNCNRNVVASDHEQPDLRLTITCYFRAGASTSCWPIDVGRCLQ